MNRYLIPLLLVIISGAMVVVYVVPTYENIRVIQLEAQAVEEDIGSARAASEKLSEFAAEVAKFPDDGLERLDTIIPASLDPVKFIVDIDAIALRHGLALRGPKVQSTSGTPDRPLPYVEHTITFGVRANYDTFKALLLDLEENLAVGDIKKIGIKTGDAFASTAPSEEKRGDLALVINEYDVTMISYSLH